MIPQPSFSWSPSAAASPVAADALFAFKKQALENAKRNAVGQPTLDDYLAAFQALAPDMQAQGIPCTPEVAADLRGQTLDGFLIQETKNHPTAAFYDNLNFKDAILNHCLVDPAASFNTQLKDAKEIADTTFNDHDKGTFELGHGNYRNIQLTNFKGGEITFAHSHVDGLNMQGQQMTSLTLGKGTSITNLAADNASIVKIVADPTSSISQASFKGATISMAGEMQGMQLRAVDFSGANLQHVDLQGAKLQNVTLPAQGCNGLNLSGAMLDHVQLDDGRVLVSVEQLQSLGIAFDAAKPPMMVYAEQEKKPATDPLKQALAGINLAALGVRGGGEVQPSIVQPTELSAEAQKAAPVKSDPPVDLRSYYAQMSESGGKPA